MSQVNDTQSDQLISEPSPTEILERQLQSAQHPPAQEMALHMSLGHLYRELGQYDSAVEQYDAARSTAAHLANLHALVLALSSMGEAHLQQGRLRIAKSTLEKAHALDSNLPRVAHLLGNVERESGNFEAALKLYQQAQTPTSELNGILLTDIADLQARKGEAGKALENVQFAIKQFKSQVEPFRLSSNQEFATSNSVLGSIYHMRGDLQRAKDAYSKAFKIQDVLRADHPNLIATRLRLARLARDGGDLVVAQKDLKNIVDVLSGGKRESAELRSAKILQADLHRQQGRYQEAKTAIEESLVVHSVCCDDETQPELAVAMHVYGSILHDQNQYSDALQKYQSALELLFKSVGSLHPESAAVHNSLGTLYQDMNDDVAAEQHFAKCLEIQFDTLGPKNPELSNTYNNLATLLFRRGQQSEAVQLLSKALAVLDAAGVPPSNPERAVYEDNLAAITSSPLSV